MRRRAPEKPGGRAASVASTMRPGTVGLAGAHERGRQHGGAAHAVEPGHVVAELARRALRGRPRLARVAARGGDGRPGRRRAPTCPIRCQPGLTSASSASAPATSPRRARRLGDPDRRAGADPSRQAGLAGQLAAAGGERQASSSSPRSSWIANLNSSTYGSRPNGSTRSNTASPWSRRGERVVEPARREVDVVAVEHRGLGRIAAATGSAKARSRSARPSSKRPCSASAMAASAPSARALRSPSAVGLVERRRRAPPRRARSPTAEVGVGQREAGAEAQERRRPVGVEARHGRPAVLHRLAQPAAAVGELPGQQLELRRAACSAGQGGEPAVDGLGRTPHERASLARDRLSGGRPSPRWRSAAPPRRPRGPPPRARRPAARPARGARRAAPPPRSDGAGSRRKSGCRTGLPDSPPAGEQQPALAEAGARADAGGLGEIEVGRHGRRQQPRGAARDRARPAAPPRSSRRAGRATAAGRPARRRPRPAPPPAASPRSPPCSSSTSLGQRLAPAGEPQVRLALGGGEGQLGAPELRHPPRGALAGQAHRERAAAGHGQAQQPVGAADQPRGHRQRRGPALQRLGVVEADHERIDEQPRQLAPERRRRQLGIDRFARRRQALGEHVDRARERVADRLDDQLEQPPAVAARRRRSGPRPPRRRAARARRAARWSCRSRRRRSAAATPRPARRGSGLRDRGARAPGPSPRPRPSTRP